MQPAVVLGLAGFRVRQDVQYRESLAAARDHHLPHSAFLRWDADDREAVFALQGYQDECCSTCGVHPSVWKRDLGGHPNAVAATWKFCRVCELVEQANEAGPPGKHGYHLTLTFNR